MPRSSRTTQTIQRIRRCTILLIGLSSTIPWLAEIRAGRRILIKCCWSRKAHAVRGIRRNVAAVYINFLTPTNVSAALAAVGVNRNSRSLMYCYCSIGVNINQPEPLHVILIVGRYSWHHHRMSSVVSRHSRTLIRALLVAAGRRLKYGMGENAGHFLQFVTRVGQRGKAFMHQSKFPHHYHIPGSFSLPFCLHFFTTYDSQASWPWPWTF